MSLHCTHVSALNFGASMMSYNGTVIIVCKFAVVTFTIVEELSRGTMLFPTRVISPLN